MLQLALDHPGLVQSLILIEPAAGGGFVVPAVEELGRRFVGPAIGAFTAGDLDTAFDLFMRGVCGEHYRSVLEQRLGVNAVDEAIRQSAFFFRDEVPAVLESTFSPAQAARIRCPVLVAEGEDSAVSGPLSQQITALATELLPHAAVMRVAGTNHMMPLQDPDSVAAADPGFRQPTVVGNFEMLSTRRGTSIRPDVPKRNRTGQGVGTFLGFEPGQSRSTC